MQWPLLRDEGYTRTVGRLFDAVTPENELKWDVVHPRRDRYDFAPADAVVERALADGQRPRGHPLVWHSQNPTWLNEGRFSRREMIGVLRRHIRTVAGRYRGRIRTWDVVNEPLADDGSLRDTLWLRGIGPDYIALAFRFAREADPGARLVLNDYGNEAASPKAAGTRRLVRRLKREGVPIDAVGVQAHVDASPIRGFVATLRGYAALGVDVELTEVDVRLPDDGSVSLGQQAEAYERIVAGCLRVPRCTAITFWGLDDRDSWIPGAFPGFGRATLFDGELRPKPAFAAVRRALRGG